MSLNTPTRRNDVHGKREPQRKKQARVNTSDFSRDFLRAFDQVFCASRPWLRDQHRDCFGSHGGFGMVRAADRRPSA